MNGCQRPKQIHLTDALLYCLEKWRAIIACMLIAAVLAGANSFWSTVKANRAAQNAQPTEEDIVDTEEEQAEESDTRSPVDSYERALAEMERDLEIQEDYLENSVVMQLEPYHISTGILSYYLKSSQNTESIATAYGTFVSSGRMAEELYSKDADVPVEDLRYLVTFSNNINGASGQGGVFQIQIKMPDSELSEVYLKRAEEIIQEYASELQAKTAEHQLILLSSVQSEMADLEIQRYQSTVRSTYMTAVRNVQTLRTETEGVQSAQKESGSSAPSTVIVLQNPVSLAIKAAVIGLVLGACAACVVLILFYLFGGKLQAVEDCKNELGMPLLGLVRASEKKKTRFGFIDSGIFRLRGGHYGRICFEEQVKIAAANVQAAVQAEHLNGKAAKIMLAGTLPEKDIEVLCKALTLEMQSQASVVSPYRQLVFQSLALKELENYDGVVFLERQGISSPKFIEQERRSVLDRNVEVLGMVVVC